jgi:hypothetical protein
MEEKGTRKRLSNTGKTQAHDWVSDYGGSFLMPALPVRMSERQSKHHGYSKT